ncbi:hypothetical protein [Cognatishimia activa]|uniref:hypothetical protein n=1 Tax=Cognatishimia activa TaxID=1715691 RepID=UPI00222E1E98|nr:hypothetical protein [Cognatishimia activa]UZD92242.1 hypothetical protein M0D42_06430 [Cognatishimia activa]
MNQDINDPKGLIRESYNIEGIDASQCRSIFMDWALGTDDPTQAKAQIEALLAKYEPDHPDHPMTEVLREGTSNKMGASDGARRTGRRRR